MDVYPQSTVRDVLLGREDPRALLRTPSQVHALQGLSDDEIERARQRILAAIADRRGADVCDEAMVEAKPAIVQIAAHDPDAAVAAARLILELSGGAAGAPVAAIDLNLGVYFEVLCAHRSSRAADSSASLRCRPQGVRKGDSTEERIGPHETHATLTFCSRFIHHRLPSFRPHDLPA